MGRQLPQHAVQPPRDPQRPRPDCITYHNPGWKAARSLHPGGVNALFCDGHVAFAKNSVDPGVSRAGDTIRRRSRLFGCLLKGLGSLSRAGQCAGQVPARL